MPELPEYVSAEQRVVVTVDTPEGREKTFKTSNDFIRFIDVRKDGVWIRNENQINTFYPENKIKELKMETEPENLPEELQKQRRK